MPTEQRRQTAKTGPFLLELILVILFLAIASAICMRIFAASYLLSQRGSDLSNATNQLRNVSEQFKASESAQAFLTQLALPTDGETATLYYDKDWNRTADSGAFSVELTLTDAPLATVTFVARRVDKADSILTVTAKKFFGQ